jgi:PIN domain nuclease of toxin-antitoxin system
MSSVVLDTHAAVWYLLKSERISSASVEAVDRAARTGQNIYVASVSLVEIIFLVEKFKIEQAAFDLLLQVLSDPETGWVLAPLDLGTAETVAKVSRDTVPDMPDRIIAATALYLELPLVTRDSKLRASGLKTIW